jgi:hypothetical protein
VRSKVITRNIVIAIVFLSLLFSTLSPPKNIIALSPSFARQGIINQNSNWSILRARQNFTHIDIPPGVMELAKNNDQCKREPGPRPPSISAVTYLSDGKRINATLWLSGPFIPPPSNATAWLHPPFREIPWYQVAYLMSIHVRSAYDTGGPDYRSGFGWSVRNGSWIKTLYEYSPIGGAKALNEIHNYQAPIGRNYVDLSLDLRPLNYPNLYDILFMQLISM